MTDLLTDVNDLGEQAVVTLKAYLQDTEPDKRDETRAKIAASVFSSVVRLTQAQGARDAMLWSMAQHLMDKDQQKEYVRVTMPGTFLSKALPGGKENGQQGG